MSYKPDCADCPTPDECKAKNDCQVMRQIRHPKKSKPSNKGRVSDKDFARQVYKAVIAAVRSYKKAKGL